MISTTPTNPWIARVRPTNGAVLRLFCFPYAGGGAAAYRPWSNELPSQIDVCAVQLPGRETRLREAPFTRIGPLVETLERALRPYCDLPAAYFGHSMGALIAFELARQQRRLGRPGPVRLFVSGHHGPQLPDPHKPLHRLPKDEFVAELRRLNGTPEVVLQNAEIMELLLPYLRADLEDYRDLRLRTGRAVRLPNLGLRRAARLGGEPRGGAGLAGTDPQHVQAAHVPRRPFLHSFGPIADNARCGGRPGRARDPPRRTAAVVMAGPGLGSAWPTGPDRPAVAQSDVHVWAVSLDPAPAVLNRLAGYLSEAERARAGRFYFERDARRYRVSHGALREILASYLLERPERLCFEMGPYGKPGLVPGGAELSLTWRTLKIWR